MTITLPLNPYDHQADPVIQALIAQARADPLVLGLVLLGSRALGFVTSESDYDAMFVVSQQTFQQYERDQSFPDRRIGLSPPLDIRDIWTASMNELSRAAQPAWELPSWYETIVLYDPSGEVTSRLESMRTIPPDERYEVAALHYDGYLNALYRSLKSWRRGLSLGARLEAVTSADELLHTLFALQGLWKPYSSRIPYHLPKLSCQGWYPGELENFLFELISTGDPASQQSLARRVVALMQERGFDRVYAEWDGQIDLVLSWGFAARP
jgi:hypothetical protein